jgi:hypothetical protein
MGGTLLGPVGSAFPLTLLLTDLVSVSSLLLVAAWAASMTAP